jgi:nicotinic acid phosphoribosyltransferase
MKDFTIPFPVRTDSYKAGHFMMYPNAQKMVAYGELRKAYPGIDDDRIVFYGIRYIVENVLNHKWTVEEVEEADKFFQTHNAGFTPYPFPKNLFLKFIKENNGYFPIKVEALPEGTVIYPHVPIYQITAEAPYAHLCTYLETLMTMIWYPTTVATLSRHARTLIERFFQTTVDAENFWKLDSRLHDFGYRGCTSQEQAVIGGVAHLLNFGGSDTMSAAYYAQFYLNEGRPVATSIPATEHSVMTSYATEQQAVERMMEMF